MKKVTIIALALISLFNVAAIFQSYNYIAPTDFKKWLETDKPVIIVDIQGRDAFSMHHFPNSIETNSFPVKSKEDKSKIDPAVAQFKKTGEDVVVICPMGKGGAKRCYSYLKSQGVPDDKLYILEGGVKKWPYEKMMVGR